MPPYAARCPQMSPDASRMPPGGFGCFAGMVLSAVDSVQAVAVAPICDPLPIASDCAPEMVAVNFRKASKAAKAIKKGPAFKEKKPPRMTPDEKRLAREMHFDRGMQPVQVAKCLGRGLSSVCRLLAQKKAPKPIGRPKILSKERVDKLIELLKKMVDDAEALHEVTMDMLMRRSRIKACRRVVADALHLRGYYFRDLREKPILTPEDVKERFAFAKRYKDKSSKWWQKKVRIHLERGWPTLVSGFRFKAPLYLECTVRSHYTDVEFCRSTGCRISICVQK